MVVVRNVFHLKFGKAREGVAAMKEGIAIARRGGLEAEARLLTDLTGPFYTLVLELTYPDVAASQAGAAKIMGNAEWQRNYEKFAPLVDSGSRELFTVVG